jgi:dTDP-4-dehydrorhamnose 3,5-epimerase
LKRFTVIETPINGLKVLQRQQIGDDRGYLERLYCTDELGDLGWPKPIAQINHSFTGIKGTVRGMHFQQQPHVEAKLVSCIQGEIWDVAVDLRAGSTTYLQWHAQILSAENRYAYLIPEGFAHGFQTLSDDCELIYVHSAAYAPQSDVGLNPRDSHLAIDCPIGITELSDREARHPELSNTFVGISL